MTVRRVVAADLTWVDGAFQPAIAVWLDGEGRIDRLSSVGEAATAATAPNGSDPPVELLRLERKALLPGFVDAHSHAFQRGLRGSGETVPEGAGSFWTWREAMYALVERLDADELHGLALRAFREMRGAGITAVG